MPPLKLLAECNEWLINNMLRWLPAIYIELHFCENVGYKINRKARLTLKFSLGYLEAALYLCIVEDVLSVSLFWLIYGALLGTGQRMLSHYCSAVNSYVCT